MNFLDLEDLHKKWQEILVIGKTIERNNEKYHIVGMTLEEEARLYIIEPYQRAEEFERKRRGRNNQRKLLKEHDENESCYLHCSEICIGDKRLRVQGGSGGPLEYSLPDYGIIQLFFDMMSAGWVIPEWLKEIEWKDLQLVTLDIADVKKLPEYSLDTPIAITHSPNPIRHTIEKTVTMHVGKSHSFSFIDNHGDEVQCYINRVSLIDVWKTTEETLSNPQFTEMMTREQLQQVKKIRNKALEQSCPKGMCYIGIEYECTKDMSLGFYSKQYLKSYPEMNDGSFFVAMMSKPDHETGTHGLPLKGSVIQTAVSPDTLKIPAELFFYYENVAVWEEHV